jgi:hypothetical protein
MICPGAVYMQIPDHRKTDRQTDRHDLPYNLQNRKGLRILSPTAYELNLN